MAHERARPVDANHDSTSLVTAFDGEFELRSRAAGAEGVSRRMIEHQQLQRIDLGSVVCSSVGDPSVSNQRHGPCSVRGGNLPN